MQQRVLTCGFVVLHHLLLFLVVSSAFLLQLAWPAAMTPQSCTANASNCESMTTYFSAENFRIADAARLFGVHDYSTLLGPNNFNLSLPSLAQQVIPASLGFVISPQTCGCVFGQRAVTSTNYTVASGDTLSTIADSYFAGLVTYEEIAKVNGIPNVDLIQIGQVISIPIPCACSPTSGGQERMLSYQIQSADTLQNIAQQYGTSVANLYIANDLNASSMLQAQSVLFVPRSVCKANFSKSALDFNLTVVYGTYELTANNCVMCSCNNGTLYCTPTPSSFAGSCANLTCASSSLTLGQSVSLQEKGTCKVTSCIYKGHTGASILSQLEIENDPTCPAAPPPEDLYEPPLDIAASPIGSANLSPPTGASPPPPTLPYTPGANAPPPQSGSSVATFSVYLQCLGVVLFLTLTVPSLTSIYHVSYLY